MISSMHWLLNYLLGITLTLFSCNFFAMATDFPMGINLGPEHFTSAYITGTNEVVTVARVEPSQAWKDFFLDTLKPKRTSEQKEAHATSKEVKEMIRSALSSIREASQKQLGRPLEINAISFPEHFKGGVYAREIIYTAIEIYPEIKDILQGRPYLDNIRLVYGLNTGEGLGYGPGADIDDYHSLLLHIDLQKSFLEVSIMIVTEFVDLRTRKFLIDDFGGCENIASKEELTDLKIRIQSLVDEELRDKTCQTQLSNFRFIIVSGEASSSEFQKIRQAIVDVFPEFSSRFLDYIDPFWVGAIAAAYRAKEFAIKPPDAHKSFNYQFLEGIDVPDEGSYDGFFTTPEQIDARRNEL